MNYQLKRYGMALRAYRKWWWLLVPLLGLYLLWMAFDDVEYTVSQSLAPYSADIPVAATASPRDTHPLQDILGNPDLLFQDGFALTKLMERLNVLPDQGRAFDEKNLRHLMHQAMSLSLSDGVSLQLTYRGKDAQLGQVLVSFYSTRLLSRIEDGRMRTRSPLASAMPDLQPTGTMSIEGRRYPWKPDRLLPAVFMLLLSSLGVLVLIALLELLDPTFKSERQMARYLGVPVLGSMPDADLLTRTLPG